MISVSPGGSRREGSDSRQLGEFIKTSRMKSGSWGMNSTQSLLVEGCIHTEY
jgi:hypothetical protein